MRILLFLATNVAILVLVGIVFNLLGLQGILAENGVDLNLGALLIMCALFGFGGSLISLFLSKWMAKRGTGTRIIETPGNTDEKWLIDTVKALADEARIGMPEVGIFPSDSANAFATGWNRNGALVAVSVGLLQRFKPAEVRAVLAHEIGHVANGDMVTLTLIQGVVNTFVLFLARDRRVVAELGHVGGECAGLSDAGRLRTGWDRERSVARSIYGEVFSRRSIV